LAGREHWLDKRRSTILLPELRADRRLIGLIALEQNFDNNSVAAWQAGGDFRPVVNCGNELAAAAALLPYVADNARLGSAAIGIRRFSIPKTGHLRHRANRVG
jgi:hypothetical protein